MKVAQISLDAPEAWALLFNESIHISLTLPMVYEQVTEGWRRDLVLGSDEVVF